MAMLKAFETAPGKRGIHALQSQAVQGLFLANAACNHTAADALFEAGLTKAHPCIR